VTAHPGLFHRSARVEAEVEEDLPWWLLLKALVPGGSITGCPKIAAMEVIRDLETTPRGPYTGAFGVVTGAGDLELALPIRTLWHDGETVRFAAGCGIVWQSDAAAEELESRLKVARFLELLR